MLSYILKGVEHSGLPFSLIILKSLNKITVLPVEGRYMLLKEEKRLNMSNII